VDRAVSTVGNLFDTADVYALGDSERFLGEALRSLGVPPESYLIATKAFGPMGKGPNDVGASRGHLLDAVKASVKRLASIISTCIRFMVLIRQPRWKKRCALSTTSSGKDMCGMLACPTWRHGRLPRRLASQRISVSRDLVLSMRITRSRVRSGAGDRSAAGKRRSWPAGLGSSRRRSAQRQTGPWRGGSGRQPTWDGSISAGRLRPDLRCSRRDAQYR
jgi:hypothetical protein